MSTPHYGRAAYAVYGEVVAHVNVRGEPLPDWDDLGDTVQRAWTAAGDTIARDARRHWADDLSELTAPELYDAVIKQAAGF